MQTAIKPVKSKAALMRTLAPGMVLHATYHGDWDPRTGQGSFERVVQEVRTKGFSYESPDGLGGVWLYFDQKDSMVAIHSDGLGWDMVNPDKVVWASYRFGQAA